LRHTIICPTIQCIKHNISVTIESELLEKVKASSPDKNRSKVIEEALELWISQNRKKNLANDAMMLKAFIKDSLDIENLTLNDGLDEI